MSLARALLLLLLCRSSVLQAEAFLQVAAPPSHRAQLGESALLPCSITVGSAIQEKYMAVIWSFQGEEIVRHDNRLTSLHPRMSINKQEILKGNASLTIQNITIGDSGKYTCRVTYTPDREKVDTNLTVYAKPLLSVSNKKVQVNIKDSLTCMVSGFFPSDIGITWLKDGEVLKDSIMEEPQQNADGTYQVTSTLPITATTEEQKRTFSCRVQHASLPQPLQKDLRLDLQDGEETSTVVTVVCSILGVSSVIVAVMSFFWWKRKKRSEAAKKLLTVQDIEGPAKLVAGEDVTLHCTATCQEDISVTWLEKRGREKLEICPTGVRAVQEEETLLNTPYAIMSEKQGANYSSSLKFRPSLAKHKDMTLICRFQCGKSTKEKTFHCRPLYEYSWKPVVEIQVPCLYQDTPVTLQCNISEYFPGDVAVTWLRRNKETEELVEETEALVSKTVTQRREADDTYSCTSNLTIIPTLLLHQGAAYICQAEHPSLEKPIETETGKLQVTGKPRMVSPIEVTMGESSRVHFTLHLQKFYPIDIEILWRYEGRGGNFLIPPNDIFTYNDDLTHDVISDASTSVGIFTDPQIKVYVTWRHQTLEEEESRSLSVRDLPWPPQVGEIVIPNMEENKAAALSCDVSGYFPDHVTGSWFRKEDGGDSQPILTPLSGDPYRVSHDKKPQKNNLFSCRSSLIFSPSLSRDQGAEFICRVEHPSLEHPIERSTGPVQLTVHTQHPTPKGLTALLKKKW